MHLLFVLTRIGSVYEETPIELKAIIEIEYLVATFKSWTSKVVTPCGATSTYWWLMAPSLCRDKYIYLVGIFIKMGTVMTKLGKVSGEAKGCP